MDSLDSQLTNLRMHHRTLMSLLPFTLSVARTSRVSDRSDYPRGEEKKGGATTESSSSEHSQETMSNGSISPNRLNGQALRSRSRSPTNHLPAPNFTTSYPPEHSSFVPTPRNPHSPDRPSYHAHRASVTSLFSDVASLYFDAEIDPDIEHQLDGQVQAAWTNSALLAPMSPLEEGIWLNDSMSEMTVAGPSPSTVLRQASDEEIRKRSDSMATLLAPRSTALVQRRKALPAPTPAVEPSLLGLMKKNIGKDFASISVDVSFNEPISLLQRLAETVEYASLLTK
jgi:oxysterol-binding protein-related protein 3/6/7